MTSLATKPDGHPWDSILLPPAQSQGLVFLAGFAQGQRGLQVWWFIPQQSFEGLIAQ